MRPPLPQVRDLVLVGGGHAHVHVLKAFAMRPVSGLRISLLTRDVDTPYSGMLPGHVGGEYQRDDVHINLLRLARLAGARLFIGSAEGIDPERKLVRFAGDRTLRYDALSINTGAVPNCPFDDPSVIPVKPIGSFLPGWNQLRSRLGAGATLTVVGGGAGGVEIALAARRVVARDVDVRLVTAGTLLPEHGERVVELARRALMSAQVTLDEHFRVEDIADGMVIARDGRKLRSDAALWVTGVAAPDWLAATSLPLDDAGFLAVDEYLRCEGQTHVFAAGDVAGMRQQPRAKSGVFAVRQGPVLARNLRAVLLQRPAHLRRYRAQQRFLALLNCADGTAIASYGGFAARSRALWRLKDWIDRRFMARFNRLPDLSSMADNDGVAGRLRAVLFPPDEIREHTLDHAMRCGGCGSKLNATLLDRVLRDLRLGSPPQWVRQSIGDDAAVLEPAGSLEVLTTDGFRSMLDDPRLFGRVTARHALSDVHAMGALPRAALATAVVPLMSEDMMAQELRDMLAGVVEVLEEENVVLIGGHSAEGAEAALHLTVTGAVAAQQLRKSGADPDDCVVLSRPLGTGVLLAAAMRGELAAADWSNCLHALDQSNRAASQVLRKHHASSATDVTGFGLLGHLLEMLQSGAAGGVELHLDAIPLLAGACSAAQAGTRSSLYAANARALEHFELLGDVATRPELSLLVDPQTAGGLLATVPAARAEACVQDMRDAGYGEAAIIGHVRPGRLCIR